MSKDRSLFKRLLIYLVLLTLIALVIYIFPYYKKPPADYEDLDVVYENYEVKAQALSERSERDRRMLEQLLIKFSQMQNKSVAHFVLTGPPPYDLDRIKSNHKYIEKITFLDPMFKSVVKDKVKIRQDIAVDADTLSVGLMFDFFDIQMAMAILQVDRGNTHKAAERIVNSLRIANGLVDSTFMQYVVAGSRILQTIDETVVYLHPLLKTADLVQIQKTRDRGPDRMRAFINSLAVETVSLVEYVRQAPKTDLDGIYLAGPCVENWSYRLTHSRCWFDTLKGAVIYLPGVLKRQQYGIIYYFAQMENSFKLWAKGGATGIAPEVSSTLKDQMENFPLTNKISPDLTDIASKMGAYQNMGKGVTTAIRAEIQRRHIPTIFEYGAGKKIVRHDTYGAIE